MRWPIALAFALTLAASACESDRARGGGSPTSKRDGGGVASDATSSSDASVGVDAAADDGGASVSAAELVYDGPLDGNARIPGWDANAPKPLISASLAGSGWFYGGARIEADGAITNLSTDRVRAWVVSGAAIIYDGPLDANARVPGWNAVAPNPHLLLAQLTDSTAWVVSGSSVDDSGSLGGLVTDRVVVWSWTSDAPVLAADAMLGSARISPWDTSAPPPLVIFVRQDNNALWYTQLAQVDADGVIGGVVADRARAWSFPAP